MPPAQVEARGHWLDEQVVMLLRDVPAVVDQLEGEAFVGQALVRDGRREEGLVALRRGQAARPRRPEAWLTLAEGFEAANDKVAAEACRRAARELIGS